MNISFGDERRADRLSEITRKVGYALWQLQTLETSAAQYYVLTVQATRGMGEDAGNLLIDKAVAGTFGATITKLRSAGKLSEGIEGRLRVLLVERNWLVHKSRSTSGDAIHDDVACQTLLDRLGKIADESVSILSEIGRLTESFAAASGVPIETIEKETFRLLEKWHAS